MPRAPPGLSLLLMAALAFAATPPLYSPTTTTDEKDDKLKIINPWLSACDLMQPASSTDLKGACPDMWGPGGPSCPQPCPPSPPAAQPPASITTGSSSSSNSGGGGSTIHHTSSTTSTSTANNNNNHHFHHQQQQQQHDSSNRRNNNSTTQCLFKYLKESHKEEVCSKGVSREERRRRLSGFRMRHCCEHAVDTSLPAAALDGDTAECARMVDALLAVDALAARISCEFAEVLYRYDCGQKYSIKHQCEDCKEAYRKWVCSSMVPHYFNRTRVRPCPSVCQSVEQKCPYMLPGDRAPAHPTQYAGEPTFLCLDPNIPETGDQRLKSSVGDEDCCYNYSNNCRTSSGRPTALCVHCPSGPADIAATPVNCAASLGNGTTSCSTSTSTITSSSSSSSTSSSASSSLTPHRTLNKVLPLWTAWIMLIQLLVSPASIATAATTTTYTLYLIVLRLAVSVNMLCAFSVRTSSLLLTRIKKTKWRSRGRWS